MKVRFARVITGLSGSELAKTPHAARRCAPDARARRGPKLVTAIAYPYVAEPVREPAAPSRWPFALTTPPAPPKPAQPLGAEAEFRAATRPPIQAPPRRVPPPAGCTEPPPAPPTQPSLEASLPPQQQSPEVPPPDSQPAPLADAADGGEQQPGPGLEERPGRARIVARLWEDPIREEFEVNLGATTESNLYVDVDLCVANGGVFVATYQDLPPGTRVSLQITLAGGLVTTAHGRVTLQRQSLEAFGDPAPGVCVAFELLSNEALALLEQFASMRTPWLIEDE